MQDFQKKALILLGAEFLPFLAASPWVGVLAFSDVVIGYGLSVFVFKSDFTLEEALLTFEMGVVFGAFGYEMTLWREITKQSIARSVRLFAKQAGRATEKALRIASEETLLSLSEKLVEKGYRAIDWVDRLEAWSRIAYESLENEILPTLRRYLREAARGGGRFEKDLLDDLASGKIQLAFRADLKPNVGGLYFPETNLLLVNPLGRSRLKWRNLKEMASDILHEYVHYRGYNELRAHWEQFVFMLRLLRNRAHRGYGIFPEFSKELAGFHRTLRREGKEAAMHYMQRHIVYHYEGILTPARLIKQITPLYHGHKRLINEYLPTLIDWSKIA